VIATTRRRLGSDDGIAFSIGGAFRAIGLIRRLRERLAASLRRAVFGALAPPGEYFSRCMYRRISYSERMAWTDQLWKPIKLADGSVIKSLADATALVSGLARRIA
jgi:hypothetical protein